MANPSSDSWRLDGRSLAIVVAIAFVNGVVAGVRWHRPVAALFHLDERPAVQPCPYHPDAPENEAHACSICGRPLRREIAYWWDPSTSPPFVSDHAGKSPAGAPLVPVYVDELPASPGRGGPCGG